MGGRWGLKGRSGCRGCGSPLVKDWQLPKHRMTPALSFLKITKKYTAVTMPQAAPVWEFQYLACPQRGALGIGSGPNSEGRSLFQGAPRMSSQTSLPLHLSWVGGLGCSLSGAMLPWVLIGSALSFPCTLFPGATMRSQSSCNQTCMSSATAGCFLPAP